MDCLEVKTMMAKKIECEIYRQFPMCGVKVSPAISRGHYEVVFWVYVCGKQMMYKHYVFCANVDLVKDAAAMCLYGLEKEIVGHINGSRQSAKEMLERPVMSQQQLCEMYRSVGM